jgi:hypothetical protein
MHLLQFLVPVMPATDDCKGRLTCQAFSRGWWWLTNMMLTAGRPACNDSKDTEKRKHTKCSLLYSSCVTL